MKGESEDVFTKRMGLTHQQAEHRGCKGVDTESSFTLFTELAEFEENCKDSFSLDHNTVYAACPGSLGDITEGILLRIQSDFIYSS